MRPFLYIIMGRWSMLLAACGAAAISPATLAEISSYEAKALPENMMSRHLF
jgi:hypothetical protein